MKTLNTSIKFLSTLAVSLNFNRFEREGSYSPGSDFSKIFRKNKNLINKTTVVSIKINVNMDFHLLFIRNDSYTLPSGRQISDEYYTSKTPDGRIISNVIYSNDRNKKKAFYHLIYNSPSVIAESTRRYQKIRSEELISEISKCPEVIALRAINPDLQITDTFVVADDDIGNFYKEEVLWIKKKFNYLKIEAQLIVTINCESPEDISRLCHTYSAIFKKKRMTNLIKKMSILGIEIMVKMNFNLIFEEDHLEIEDMLIKENKKINILSSITPEIKIISIFNSNFKP